MNRRSGGGGYGNKVGNRFNDNQNYGRHSQNNNYNRGGGNYGQQQQQRQLGMHQGGGQMNAFDNRPFQQQQQQQQMMNQNQFANQLSSAVLRNSVGPNAGMMSSFGGGGNQDQQVVMVVPQSHATGGMMGGGNMGMGNQMMMQNQNPFANAVMNQPKPMQVIVGNMPGLNPAAFGQQVLPAYGQGVGEQNMGMFGQQQSQHGSSNRFGRDNINSSDRGRMNNQRNQKVTLVRRTEVNERGRMGAPRGVAKKRVIVGRDQHQQVDAKKAKVTGVVARGRLGVLRNNRLNNKARRNNKPGAGNKAAAGKEQVKKEAKPTENGTAAVETEAKEGDAVTETGEPKPSKYEEIPAELLVCKVCRKTLTSAAAFDSHLAEKSHATMMKILEEKFGKRAQMLMFESKMCEDELAVKMDRPRRSGKNQGKASKTHCKMCDCTYTVNWGTHKQSVHHRVLKEFLHPNCRFCKSQFVHRKDYVEHIMSVGHLKKLIELKTEGKSVVDQESTMQEELFAVHIELSGEEKLLDVINIHSLGGQQPVADDIKAMLQGENGEIQLPAGDIVIPETYDENAAFGTDAILKVGGNCCKVCRIYIPEGDEQSHCKSRPHFDFYVQYLKRIERMRKAKEEEERKAKEEAEKKVKAEAEAAAKAAEDAAKIAQAEAEAKATATKTEEKPTVAGTSEAEEKMEVEQASGDAADEAENKDEEMQEDQSEAEKVVAPVTPSKEAEAAKPVAASPNKTPQRGGQNNRAARGSPARGRGQPTPRGGGYNRGGRGGGQQTPGRGGATPGGMRGNRGGGQARGGRGVARGSPGRGRGRGGW